MSLKTYTINVDGKSGGNTISSPFTIDVVKMNYTKQDDLDSLEIQACTCNGDGDECINDDIPMVGTYDGQIITSSKQNDLSNTFENTLNEKYGPGNWS
jgi:hypothetical protein